MLNPQVGTRSARAVKRMVQVHVHDVFGLPSTVKRPGIDLLGVVGKDTRLAHC